MALFGSLSTLQAQLLKAPRLAAVWPYLQQGLEPASSVHQRIRAHSPGVETRVELGDGIFALEQAYLTKDPAKARFESHRAHVDIQLIVAGVEEMQVADVRFLHVAEDFTPARDILFYADFASASALRVVAGEAAVFFPVDGHRPSLRVGDSAAVWKTVVKVPVSVFEA